MSKTLYLRRQFMHPHARSTQEPKYPVSDPRTASRNDWRTIMSTAITAPSSVQRMIQLQHVLGNGAVQRDTVMFGTGDIIVGGSNWRSPAKREPKVPGRHQAEHSALRNNREIQRTLGIDTAISSTDISSIVELVEKGSVWLLCGSAGERIILKIEPANTPMKKARRRLAQDLAHVALASAPMVKELTEAERGEILNSGLPDERLRNWLSRGDFTDTNVAVKMDYIPNLISVEALENKEDDNIEKKKAQKLFSNMEFVRSLGRTAAFDLFTSNNDRFMSGAPWVETRNIELTTDKHIPVDNFDPNTDISEEPIEEWKGKDYLSSTEKREQYALEASEVLMKAVGLNLSNNTITKAKSNEYQQLGDCIAWFATGMEDTLTTIIGRLHYYEQLATHADDEDKAIAQVYLERIEYLNHARTTTPSRPVNRR